MLKSEEKAADNADLPPGDEDSKLYTTEEETKCIRERIVSIRRKIHKNTVNCVTARWNYEEGVSASFETISTIRKEKAFKYTLQRLQEGLCRFATYAL